MTHNSDNDAYDPVVELCVAAYYGDVARLAELLADPAYRDNINQSINAETGHSALFFACYGAANAETIRILVNAGADPLQRDKHGRLPLHLAANALDTEVIAALLEIPNMNSYIFDKTAMGQTPLHAIFLPGSGIGPTQKSKNADLSKCIPFFLKRDQDPLGALRAKDNYDLSPLVLVKHLGLKEAFAPYVPIRTFEILLRSVQIPGDISDLLLKANFSYDPIQSLEKTADNNTSTYVRPKLKAYQSK